MRISARNVLKGKVARITPGAVNSEVTVVLPGGKTLVGGPTEGGSNEDD